MPTYDYECEKCEHHFKKFQRMTDDLVKKCPECGSTVKRLIGKGGGFIFKGSGFYQTDYKGSSPKKETVSGKQEKPAECGKSENCSGCEA